MEARFRSRWKKIRRPLSVIGVIAASILVIALVVGIIGGYLLNWKGSGVGQKTLWDWLQLLIIPLALAIIAIFFNRAERKNERKIASDNQQEAALQAYLDKMSELLLKENLRKSETDSEVRNIARARTLTVLPGLDAGRKGSIIEFLYETNLISINQSIIDLHDANLNDINLWTTSLPSVDLSGAYLMSSLLGYANLSNAKLIEVRLTGANLDGTNLSGANLSDAWMPFSYLMQADLQGAVLTDVGLLHADLSGANLSGADLKQADLSGANLKGVTGITVEELEKQAKSLKGATMPDGSKHE